jgi:hypothetical protein
MQAFNATGKLQDCLNGGVYYEGGYSERHLMGNVFIEYSYVIDFDDNTLDCYTSRKQFGKFRLDALPDLQALQKIQKELYNEENEEDSWVEE